MMSQTLTNDGIYYEYPAFDEDIYYETPKLNYSFSFNSIFSCNFCVTEEIEYNEMYDRCLLKREMNHRCDKENCIFQRILKEK